MFEQKSCMGSSFVPESAYTGLHQTFTDQGSQPPLRLLAALPCIIDAHLITHPPDCPASEWLTELRTVCLTCVLALISSPLVLTGLDSQRGGRYSFVIIVLLSSHILYKIRTQRTYLLSGKTLARHNNEVDVLSRRLRGTAIMQIVIKLCGCHFAWHVSSSATNSAKS